MERSSLRWRARFGGRGARTCLYLLHAGCSLAHFSWPARALPLRNMVVMEVASPMVARPMVVISAAEAIVWILAGGQVGQVTTSTVSAGQTLYAGAVADGARLVRAGAAVGGGLPEA